MLDAPATQVREQRAGAGTAISESAVVRIDSESAPLPPSTIPSTDEPAPARPVAHVQQVSKPGVGGVAAVIGVIGMVIVASAEEPVGIQLVNPAEAVVDPSAQGLQQAIYFEASDQ